MRRILYILTATLVLAGCTAREILVTKPVSIGLRIEKVSGSKVRFAVTPGKEEAAYMFFTISESESAFDKPEREAAKEYIGLMEDNYNYEGKEAAAAGEKKIGSFVDFACLRGTRTVNLLFLNQGTGYKLLLFQVHPKSHEILGEVQCERFRTKDVEMKDLDFDISFSDDLLTIEPSDQNRTYVWGFERASRIEDDYDHDPFNYLYCLIDMYEEYGFIEHRLYNGTGSYDMSRERLREGEPYVVTAIGYENGEINSRIGLATFILRGGDYYLMDI